MKQCFKCLIGAHEYELLEKQEVKNIRGEIVSIAYVNRCKHCGKIISKVINIYINV